MDPARFLSHARLTLPVAAVRDGQRLVWDALAQARERSVPAGPLALQKLYQYPVPKLSPDGSCSLVEALDPEPYHLDRALGGVAPGTTLALLTLQTLVEAVQRAVGCDWLGVYQARQLDDGPALVKLAYRGLPSRAEFPLTAAFAEHSTNTQVGLSGHARLLEDVRAHVASGGAYYECDPKVQSEACLPCFDSAWAVAGLVDAEHATPGFFTPERLGLLVALALEAPRVFP
jgi:putative methionine-R-sulfoxide reductase with GAF domain